LMGPFFCKEMTIARQSGDTAFTMWGYAFETRQLFAR
jgi:hypothetical protein